MSVNATTPSRLVSRSSTLPSIHARSTGPNRGVGREERLEEAAQLGRARRRRRSPHRARPPARPSPARTGWRARGAALPCSRSTGRRCRATCARRGRCRRRARRGSRARRTRASRRRAACASSCDPGPAARAPRPVCRAAPRRRAGRSLVGTTCTLRPCLSRACPGRSRKPPAASRIVPPTSRRAAGRSPTPTSIASPTRSRSASRRAACAPATSSALVLPAGPRVPAHLRGRGQARRDHRGRERPPLGARTRRRSSTSPDPRLVVTADDAPAADSVETVLARPAGRRARRRRELDDDPDRPVAIIFTSGTTGLAEGRAVLQPPARVHHPDRRRRHVGRRRPLVQRHVVRAPRLHDEARRATCAAAARRSSWNAGARGPRSSSSPASA